MEFERESIENKKFFLLILNKIEYELQFQEGDKKKIVDLYFESLSGILFHFQSWKKN